MPSRHPKDKKEYHHHERKQQEKRKRRSLKLIGYRNPFRAVKNLRPLRIDEGVDYGGSGPVYAIGFGKVVRLDTHSGWPGSHFLAIRLTRGKAKNKVYYLAEHLTFPKKMKVGRRVRPWTRVAVLHDGYPYCETGWSQNSAPLYEPLSYSCYNEGDRTAAGDNFSDFLHELGAPRGVVGGRSTRCPLPSYWPRKW